MRLRSSWAFVLSVLCLASCLPIISSQPHPFVTKRLQREAVDTESLLQDHKPELTARHERNYTQLNCRVSKPRMNAEVYINCPALGNSLVTGPCYQGCQPTKDCKKSGDNTNHCVPNGQTVFCSHPSFTNGTVLISLKIIRTDSRLAGTWSCTHAGLESTKFEIAHEKSITSNDENVNDIQTADEIVDNTELGGARYVGTNDLDERSLAYLRKPIVVITVLTILAISVLINVGFCGRCFTMRLYIDANNEGAKNADCLAACLCLPKNITKSTSLRFTPVLPRSTNVSQLNAFNGSHHGSTHTFYPSPNMQHLPLLLGHPSSNEVSGIPYNTSGSLPGTLRKYGQSRLLGPVGAVNTPVDIFGNSQFIYQTAIESGIPLSQQTCFQTIAELGASTNHVPSYVRVPSINAPSPNLSHRILPSNPVYQAHNMASMAGPTIPVALEGQTVPQYFVRMQPNILGGHVVYDDVAAATSSLTGHYNRSPNGSVMENAPSLIQPLHLVQSQQPKPTPTTETNSCANTSLQENVTDELLTSRYLSESHPLTRIGTLSVSSDTPNVSIKRSIQGSSKFEVSTAASPKSTDVGENAMAV